MKLILAISCLLMSACTSSTFYSKGVKVAHIQADLDAVTFKSHSDGSIEFSAARMNHSLPTRAGGSVVGTAGAAVAASGILGVVPK